MFLLSDPLCICPIWNHKKPKVIKKLQPVFWKHLRWINVLVIFTTRCSLCVRGFNQLGFELKYNTTRPSLYKYLNMEVTILQHLIVCFYATLLHRGNYTVFHCILTTTKWQKAGMEMVRFLLNSCTCTVLCVSFHIGHHGFYTYPLMVLPYETTFIFVFSSIERSMKADSYKRRTKSWDVAFDPLHLDFPTHNTCTRPGRATCRTPPAPTWWKATWRLGFWGTFCRYYSEISRHHDRGVLISLRASVHDKRPERCFNGKLSMVVIKLAVCDERDQTLSCVKNSIMPRISVAGPVNDTGIAKANVIEWILQATTPNQWQAAEQNACNKNSPCLSLPSLYWLWRNHPI